MLMESDVDIDRNTSNSDLSQDSGGSVSLCCPLCSNIFRSKASRWHHINCEHVTRRSFPTASFLSKNDRKVCSSCGFCYSSHWKLCRRSTGIGRCGGTMEDPCVSSWISSQSVVDGSEVPLASSNNIQVCNGTYTASSVIESVSSVRHVHLSVCSDPALEGVKAATLLTCALENEEFIFQSLMDEITGLQVNTICHVPRSVRPLLAQVLSVEFYHACSNGIWGFARLFMFAKAVLRSPPRGGKKKRYVVSSILTSRLQQWQSGELVSLWEEVRGAALQLGKRKKSSLSQANARRALFLAKEGRFRDAMRSLTSKGCASDDDVEVVEDLLHETPS